MTEFRFDAPGAVFFRPEGPLDAIGVLDAAGHIEALSEPGIDHITVDLRDVPFMDPSGLGLLVDIAKRMKMRRGEFVIRGIAGQPLRMLQQLKLTRPLNVHPAAAIGDRADDGFMPLAQAA
ncbi:MAG: STAS domain-containing protein [Minwuia sp.]|uniref:STAS domain-containing protein n=1 Tax=Minwuia sp. TaxID=2493630 RepID=UPI003A8BBC61